MARNHDQKVQPDSSDSGLIEIIWINLFNGDLSLNAHYYGKNPFAEFGTMLRSTLLNATCTGLKNIHGQKSFETSAVGFFGIT